MQRQSDGQSTVSSLMPHGCLHQRTNLVHHLQTNSIQPQLIHPSYPLCRQPSHLWRQTSHGPFTVWGPFGRWILWKTHYSRNGTWPRVSWLHAWDQTTGTDLPRAYQCFSSPLTVLSIFTQSTAEWVPFPLLHCDQGCLPRSSCSTRSWPINSFVHTCWISQGGTPRHFQSHFDSASEPSAAWDKPVLPGSVNHFISLFTRLFSTFPPFSGVWFLCSSSTFLFHALIPSSFV